MGVQKVNKIMKLSISLFVSVALVQADTPCGVTCMREFIRDDIKCDQMEEATEEEKMECSNEAFRNFWQNCLGDKCGNTMPDGRCGYECIPPLEDGVAKCDEALANGEINSIEHYKCVMGPGGPADMFDKCFEDCVCSSPWCNCTPPEIALQQTGFIDQLHLRDTTITCYPDKL